MGSSAEYHWVHSVYNMSISCARNWGMQSGRYKCLWGQWDGLFEVETPPENLRWRLLTTAVGTYSSFFTQMLFSVCLSVLLTHRRHLPRGVFNCAVLHHRWGREIRTNRGVPSSMWNRELLGRKELSTERVTRGGGQMLRESLAFPCSRLALKLPDDYSSRMSLVPREISLFIGVK